MSKKEKRIRVAIPPEFVALAKIIGCTPAEILEQFIQDLLRLPRSGGSDERDMAGEYFLRTNQVGCDYYETVREYLSTSRAEFQCQVCRQWVRHSKLRFVREPRPHFVCWIHPSDESETKAVQS